MKICFTPRPITRSMKSLISEEILKLNGITDEKDYTLSFKF